MKKTFTKNEMSLKGLFLNQMKAVKLFAILALAGTSVANAQLTNTGAGHDLFSKQDLLPPVERNGSGQNSSSIQSVSNPAFQSITSLDMVDMGYNKVLVEWNASMVYDSILIRFTVSGSGLYRNISIPGNPNPGRFFIMGMLSETTYDIQIATVFNNTTSSWSAPLTVTTLAEPGPRMSSLVVNSGKQLLFVPNPASGTTKMRFVSTQDNAIFDFNIIAPTGNYVYSSQIVSSVGVNEVQLDLSGYTPGLYLCKMNNHGTITIEKLVVN
ncbi:MAG TPA: T9SS type A sorting domain-containing protein [Bacteroidia bacterium]|nr:T9SS type A sorting domain-containing protein [Bacteroidia bacterium]